MLPLSARARQEITVSRPGGIVTLAWSPECLYDWIGGGSVGGWAVVSKLQVLESAFAFCVVREVGHGGGVKLLVCILFSLLIFG